MSMFWYQISVLAMKVQQHCQSMERTRKNYFIYINFHIAIKCSVGLGIQKIHHCWYSIRHKGTSTWDTLIIKHRQKILGMLDGNPGHPLKISP